jgi:hypothetical protein
MNTLLLALQLLVADTSDHPFPYAIHSADKAIDWKKFETKVPTKYRDSVIKTFKVRYRDFFADEYANSDKFYNSFHFIHLNNDQLPDLVYNGWTGGEGDATFIYYNHGIEMEEIFYDHNNLVDLKFNGKNLSSLVIYRFGCCSGFVETERHYSVNSLFNFQLVRQREIIVGMNGGVKEYVAPDEYFKQPIRFKTINNEYAMRFSPGITDKPPAIDDPMLKGNIIAMFPKGASGIAWAKKTDATGREWWLVEMEPQASLAYTVFYDEEDKPTWYYGWMSSRFLERIQ